MNEDQDDVELIVRSRDVPEVFGVLFERHAEPMLTYFARRTLDAEAAAELVAETFAEAFSSRRRFRDQGADGAAWLYGIGRNLLSHYFRDEFDRAFGAAVDAAESNGGYIQDSRTRDRAGTLTIRIPAENFDEMLRASRGLGTVEVESIRGRDVTADYVDLRARLRIGKSRREVLLRLMNKAVSIEQTIRVQNALDETQLRIEQVQG
ncbi:MAG: DUF4349 domain-containing protein, partial [Thermoanaerobaculia bacterium]